MEPGLQAPLETGVAKLGNMEAVQFHPTALVPSGILMTEALQGRWRCFKRQVWQTLHARL